jgi:hypothetical protein
MLKSTPKNEPAKNAYIQATVAEPGFSYWVFEVKKLSTHQYNIGRFYKN